MMIKNNITWRKVKLGEVLEKVIDNRGKTPPLSSFGHELIETFQMSANSKYPDLSDKNKQKYVSAEIYKKWFRAGHPKEGDILFSTVGASIPQWCFVPKNSQYCIAQNLIALRPDINKVLSEYLKSYFNQKKFVREVKGIIIGAAQPSIKVPHLLSIEIIIPQLAGQKNIVSILSAFDDKIELNNKISKNLEQTAQAIFKEWFINFKFPGHEKVKMVDSELGKIPEGWEVKKIDDVAKIKKGLSYSSEEIRENNGGIPMINLANFVKGGGFKIEGTKFFNGKYKISNLVKPGDIVIALTDLTSNREVIGHPAKVPEIKGWDKILISLDVCSLETADNLKTFFYYLMLRRSFSHLMASSASGTNVSHLSQSNIKDYLFVFPLDKVLNSFYNLVKPISDRVNRLSSENQKLAALRDLLLPKLMSGGTRV